MDIDSEGNMELIGAMTSSDKEIYFRGAQGYNNAVYVFNKKCSDLYKNDSKGITARSIKEEDITSKFNSTGTGKIIADIDERVGNIETPTSNTLAVVGNITAIDKTNKTVTYKNARSYYPNLFQYEAGGLIGETETGIPGTNPRHTVTRSTSYNGYGADGILTSLDTTGEPAIAIPQSSKVSGTGTLTVPFTCSNTTHNEDDFADTTNKTAYYSMFFGAGTNIDLASRGVYCYSDFARFGMRYVGSAGFNSKILYDSYAYDITIGCRICPIVSIPSTIQVTPCTGTNSSTNTHTVVTN